MADERAKKAGISEGSCPGVSVSFTGTRLPTPSGEFQVIDFNCPLSGHQHIALVRGDVGGEDVLLRVHSECITGDLFGSLRCDCGEQLRKSMDAIAKEERGVILYLGQEGRGIGLTNKLRAYHLQDHGADTVEANLRLGLPPDARSYRCATCLLSMLGVRSVRLLTNNPAKIGELRSLGVVIKERVPIEVTPNEHNLRYLRTKKEKMGHLLNGL
jgi:3,4-dihydroxy 2-butanone 4-phosphate synthase/GTP cyclohydrolase II